jgi:hypothetical protein
MTDRYQVRRAPARPGYLLRRPTRSREKFPRHRTQVSFETLLGQLLRRYKLTETVREQCVFVFWREIVGATIGRITQPEAFTRGVLRVTAKSSVQIQELQFHRERMVQQINAWIAARGSWLGEAPITSEIRFSIGTIRPVNEGEHLDRQRLRQLRRLHAAPVVSDTDRSAIRDDVSCIDDPELRALIEGVRLRANL